MKGGILMRVLFCKIQYPFICFCKRPSSAHHLYTSAPAPLKLENRPHAVAVVPSSSSSSTANDFSVSGKSSSQNVVPKSCLRKLPRRSDVNNPKEAQMKRVEWIDFSGKELAQIKEFESSDTDDEEESNQCCVCSMF